MAAVSFSEAAQLLGHRSRSTLYRMRDDGRLAGYLRPGGKGGAQLLETHPEGRRPLAEWVPGVLGPQSPVLLERPAADREQRARELEQCQRWERVAGGLSDALAAQGLALSLTRQEAQALTDALPGVLAEVMGPEGLQLLGVEPAPLEPAADPLASVDGSPPFWSEYGRIAAADEPPLSPDEAEEHAALMAWHLAQCPDPSEPLPQGARFWLWEVEHQARNARACVAAGARWDAAAWDQASARALLEDLPCPAAAAELERLLAAGRVPEQLLAEVEAALAQQAAAA
jgi:hypothetical protein